MAVQRVKRRRANAAVAAADNRRPERTTSPPPPTSLNGVAMPDLAVAGLRDALRHYQENRIDDAAEACERLLALDPRQTQALMLLGLIRAGQGNVVAAEALFLQLLAIVPGDALAMHNLAKLRQRCGDDLAAIPLFRQALELRPDFAPTWNDLGLSLHSVGRKTEALAAFARATAVEPRYAIAHYNRGTVFTELELWADARREFESAVALDSGMQDGWYELGVACLHMKAHADAEAALRTVLDREPGHLDALDKLASLLERSDRADAALPLRREWVRRNGVRVDPCRGDRQARVLLLGAAGPYNLPAQKLLDRNRFESVVLYLPPLPETLDLGYIDPLARDCDIVFNAVANPDHAVALAPQIDAIGRMLGRPLLNPPAKIAGTARDAIARLLADVPGLLVPPTRQVDRSELAALAAAGPTFQQQLVRPRGSHGGDDLCRLDNAAALVAYLGQTWSDRFYLSDYCDYRSADGYYRKYRFVFVDGEVYPYHLAISPHWMVHYWRTEMATNSWMQREEEAFLADYHSLFGSIGVEALANCAGRLGLDYAGIDCALTPDGQVLLFEANASMRVQLTDSDQHFGYKQRYLPRIFEAIGDMVLRRLSPA